MTVAFSHRKTWFIWSILLGCLTITVLSSPIRTTVVCVPTTWEDVIVFVTVNFIAHAATTPTTAGAKWYDTLAWGVLALFLPFAALGKSLAMLCRYVQRKKNSDIYLAIARGAVINVARSKEWQPQAQPELHHVILPPNFYDEETFVHFSLPVHLTA